MVFLYRSMDVGIMVMGQAGRIGRHVFLHWAVVTNLSYTERNFLQSRGIEIPHFAHPGVLEWSNTTGW